MFLSFRLLLLQCLFCTVLIFHAFGADVTVVGRTETDGKVSFNMDGVKPESSAEAREFAAVLRGDLINSGWFKETAASSASVLLTGDIRRAGAFSANIAASWLAGTRTKSFTETFASGTVRDAAHKMADQITLDAAGKNGMASSKILFVGRRSNGADVYVCDADGGRMKRLTSDNKLCLSPRWIAGQNSFLYTSWLTGASAVYRVNLDNGRRELVAGYPGMNQGATLSPDGRFLALVLSRSGGVDMYLMELATRHLRRLTASGKINESSPAWSADGSRLVFVDDRNRSPQLYIFDSPLNLEPSFQVRQELTTPLVGGMRESVAPEFSRDGAIAFCGRKARYGIYVTTPAADPRANISILVSPRDDADYEDPSWAPDGRHIVCTRTKNFRRSLVVLDTMGDEMRNLTTSEGNWYLPSWSHNF